MVLGIVLVFLLASLQAPLIICAETDTVKQYFPLIDQTEDDTSIRFTPAPTQQDNNRQQKKKKETLQDVIVTQRRIENIYIVGNMNISDEAIFQRVPYQQGEIFTPNKTTDLIKSVYTFGNLPYNIGYFKYVNVSAHYVEIDKVDLYVYVQEKYPLEEVVMTGDKHLTSKELNKKIDFSEIPVVDEEDVKQYVNIIKKVYQEKNYHQAQVTGHLQVQENKATMYINIKEGRQSVVKRVFFKGNHTFSDKKLRSIIFTREDWLLSFLDKAGTYQPEAIESDKHTLEHFYQSNGFLNAKVINTDVCLDEKTHQFFISFEIDEGDLYTISKVHAPGNYLYTQEELLTRIPVRCGQVYSKERIREVIEVLRLLWGEHGYIYADIAPSIQPNDDAKTVEITFYSELGPEVYLRRINILGNQKTHDRVIRRNITLCEGELLTTKKMDETKERVELLGYFNPRDGVNWKMNRIDKNTVDLDLLVKEEKTGKIYGQLGFGGNPTDIQSPADSLSFGAVVTDTNLLGLGIHFNVSGNISKEQKTFAINITEPWLFDRPIHAAFDVVYKRSDYEDFKFTQENVKENFGSGSIAFGFLSDYFCDTKFVIHLGIDDIRYNPDPRPKRDLADFSGKDISEFERVLSKRFTSGTFAWVSGYASQDLRNHPIHPSRGYQWAANGRVGIPGTSAKVGFFKCDFDFSWYTPLIGERDLVFCFHSHAGFIYVFNRRLIPYRELYHIGGPASVRGFLFGEIGPSFKRETSIGGKNAFWLNAELIFPINSTFTMKGAVFYDGGAGWNTPFSDQISKENLKRNSFSYRHSVGFGIRLLHPTPIKLDWGFKLDRKKGERASEAHLTMYHNF